jgi:hypothetical protein
LGRRPFVEHDVAYAEGVGSEAIAKHVVPFPGTPIVPAGAGLSPGDASSVAPMGIPAGGTGEPGAMPSGEVAPIPGVGLPIPPTCANAGMQPKSAACIAAINMRRIMISIVRVQRSGRLVNNNIDAASVADVRPAVPRVVRRAAPIITISVATPVTAMAVIAMESASETAAHAGSTKVAAYAGTAEAATHMHPTETATASAGKSTAEATNVAAAATMAAAATRLRVGCKQAARQRGGHQHSHYPSQHMRQRIRHSKTLCNDIRVHGATLRICLTTKYLDK